MVYSRMMVATVLAVVLAVPVLSAAQTKEFSETVPLDSGGRLRLDGSKGSITMTAWEREEVEIRARIEAPRNVIADYARRAVDATTVDVTGTARSVRIRSNYEDVPTRTSFWDRDSRSIPYIHYEIRAPRRLSLFVESDRGPTALTGFEGEIELDASQGLTLRTDLSRRADFDSEFPLTMSSLDGRDFNGTINGGGPELFIESDRGSVRLNAVR